MVAEAPERSSPRFSSTSAATTETILSAADIADTSSNLTLSLNGAALHFEVQENTGSGAAFATNLTYPTVDDPAGSYSDGRDHTVAVNVGSQGTRIFADGHQVYAGTSTASGSGRTSTTAAASGATTGPSRASRCTTPCSARTTYCR